MSLAGYPLAVVGDIYQIRNWCTFRGQNAIFDVHYRVLTVTGSFPIDDVIQQYTSIAGPDTAVVLTNAAEYLGAQLIRIKPTVASTVRSTYVGNIGTGGVNAAPGQLSGLIQKITVLGSPAGRGRCYIPFPSMDAIDVTTQPTAAYQTNLGNLASAILDDMALTDGGGNALTMRPIVYPSGLPATGRDLIDWRVQPAFATQRSRGNLGNLGPNPWGILS